MYIHIQTLNDRNEVRGFFIWFFEILVVNLLNARFDYRLGHQVFILKRRVRFPYRVQDDGIREDEFRKDKVTNPCRKRIERVNGVIIYSPLAQLEEHLAYIQGVVGSIPTGTTKNDKVGSKTRPKSEVKTRQNRKL